MSSFSGESPCEMEVEEEESLLLLLLFFCFAGLPSSEGNVRTGELGVEEPVAEAKTRSWSANLRRASPMSLSDWKYATCAAARAYRCSDAALRKSFRSLQRVTRGRSSTLEPPQPMTVTAEEGGSCGS